MRLAAMIASGTIATSLAAPRVAQAYRSASHAETVAMIKAARPHRPHEAERTMCVIADISTVNSSYGAWEYDLSVAPACFPSYLAYGVVIEHKSKGRWKVVWEGNSPRKVTVAHKIVADLMAGLSLQVVPERAAPHA